MKTYKFLMLFLIIFFLSGCTINQNIFTSNEKSNQTANSKMDEKECKKNGGEWKKFCKPGWGDNLCGFDCYIEYNDKGKACGDSRECKSGYCIIDREEISTNYKDADKIKKRIVNQKEGKCHGDNLFPNCLGFIKDGELQNICS